MIKDFEAYSRYIEYFSLIFTFTLSSLGRARLSLLRYQVRVLVSLRVRLSSATSEAVASPTSQFIVQPVFLFSYVTSSSLISRGEPPMVLLFPQFHPTSTPQFSNPPKFVISYFHLLISCYPSPHSRLGKIVCFGALLVYIHAHR